MVGLSSEEFDEISEKNPDLRGVPVFYDAADHRRIWPRNDLGYTTHFFNGSSMFTVEEPTKIGGQ